MGIGKIEDLMFKAYSGKTIFVFVQINVGNAKERAEQGEREAKEEAERLGASPSSKTA